MFNDLIYIYIYINIYSSILHIGSSELSFDGSTSNLINLSNTLLAVQGNEARTISFNILTTQTTTSQATIFATGSSCIAGSFNIVMSYNDGNNDGIIGVMGTNNDFYPHTGTIINDGKWHTVQVTFDGSSTLNIYVDGRLDNTMQMIYHTVGNNNFIGQSNNHVSNENYFTGILKQVQYYSGLDRDTRSDHDFND